MQRLITGSLLLCLYLAGCSSPQEPRLIGTCQSDKEATLEILNKYRELTPEQLEKVGALIGKVTVTYDKRTTHFKFDTWEHTINYKVVAHNETCAVIESPYGLREGQKSFEIVRFEGDDRCVVLSQDLNFPEVFRRIKEEASHVWQLSKTSQLTPCGIGNAAG